MQLPRRKPEAWAEKEKMVDSYRPDGGMAAHDGMPDPRGGVCRRPAGTRGEIEEMSQDLGSSALRRLQDLRGFAFDLDGTIWEGPRLLPGAVELVEDLREAGLGVVFASNSSRHASGVLRHRLAELGIVATADQMLAALDLTGEEVRRRLGPVNVLSIGTDELDEILRSCGHTIVLDAEWRSARAVVVGIDPDFNYDRLRAASRAVAAGSTFFAVNLDVRFPVGPGEFDPGCGALAEAIAVAGGVRPIAIGKPETALFEAAIHRLGCAPGQAVMVGDSIASDVTGGRAAGMFTIWLDPDQEGPPPGCVDLRVRDLDELHRLWRAARGDR
jgi:glycerol-1-phosphatase